MIVLHLSDTHFGKPHRPAAAAAAAALAKQAAAGAVVVSGDLTQRAKAAEFRAARAFLEGFSPLPVVVVPGNHDVPLYRFWERIAAPWRQYRSALGGFLAGSRSLDVALDVAPAGGSPGIRFVGLASAAPRTAVVNGRVSRAQLDFAARAFGAAPRDACRALVVHHNLVRAGDQGPPPMRGAHRVLSRLDEWGVDLVLSGHVHRTWLAKSAAGTGVPLVHAGTASSSRGRPPETGANSLNLIRASTSNIEVTPYLFSREHRRFLPAETRRRRRRPH